MKKPIARYFFVLLIVIGITGCLEPFAPTPASENGKNSIAYSVRKAAPVTTCPSGGVSVDAGIDANGNGRLDESEVSNTQYVCNGNSGAAALVLTTDEPAGAHCTNGGKKISTGIDVGADGVLGANEITSSSFICHGEKGVGGKDALLSVILEPKGLNCSNGGSKIISGLDENRNNLLDTNEVSSTAYICDTVATATIEGRVTIANQTDSAGISVYIPGTRFTALTDSSGAYLLSNVLEGTYELRFEKLGYASSKMAAVTATTGQTTTPANVVLALSTGPSGRIIMADGAERVASRTVAASVAASADAVLMQLSEDVNFIGATWQPTSPTASWTFASDGIKRLYVKFAAPGGFASSPASDGITVDTVPPANATLRINDGSSAINTENVTLTLAATDVTTAVDQMRISNNPDFSNSVYEPFSSVRAWSLSSGPGVKTVYVKFKDLAGNESEQAVTATVVVSNAAAIAYYNNGIAYINSTTGALTNASSTTASYFDPTGKFAYELGTGVVSYSINANTGLLTSTGSTVTGSSLAFDSTGKIAYVFTSSTIFVSGNVTTYSIDPTTGALTSTGSTVTADGVLFEPTHKFVYVKTNGAFPSNTASFASYSLSSTGMLTPSGTPVTGYSNYGITFDPAGKFAYVPQDTQPFTSIIYSVDAFTGALTAAGTVAGMHPGYPVTFDSTGKFAYMWGGYGLPGGYGIYTYLTGSPTVTSGPVTVGDTYNIVFKTTLSGSFAYVFGSNAVQLLNGNIITNSLTTYSVDSVTGALTSPGAADYGTNITLDPSGKFAYVTRPSLTAFNAYTVSSYSVNQTTGILTLQGSAVTVNDNIPSIVFDPSGKFAYLSDSTNIITYSIDPVTGALSATGSTIPGRSIVKIIPAQ